MAATVSLLLLLLTVFLFAANYPAGAVVRCRDAVHAARTGGR
jgi:hypothetical protein